MTNTTKTNKTARKTTKTAASVKPSAPIAFDVITNANSRYRLVYNGKTVALVHPGKIANKYFLPKSFATIDEYTAVDERITENPCFTRNANDPYNAIAKVSADDIQVFETKLFQFAGVVYAKKSAEKTSEKKSPKKSEKKSAETPEKKSEATSAEPKK